MTATNAKLSAGALKKAINRHNWALQWCWNYEKMQAAGYAYAMVPVIKELYDDNDEQCRQLERHMQFYNTHPGASALIFGADVALEEAYQTETGDSLKVALMGPLAGIGDTIQAVLVTPPFNIIAAGLAHEGNAIGAILASTLPLVALFVIRWPLFNYGYKKGVEVINDVSGAGTLDKLQVGASILGVTVMGGFVPSMIGKKLPIPLGKDTTIDGVTVKAKTLQEVLDAIFPHIVPLVLTFCCYWLIKNKKVSPLKVILILALVTFALGAVGWMV
ncbi:MAG: PTS system mannose/fructose/sorbose family transporter subunit IID [Erysipelotrichaceae bacterium]|jgi:PTS system mannose-specific IID component|nr:PTS system mannose/fructose/sorbose family transporter subunit IID [Erysipelotrichaceae bacterium]MBQ4251665.1 PTS system mannose/fructose/sorbose family transporter subunit IID [Erysipelotrichaceae bacterium]